MTLNQEEILREKAMLIIASRKCSKRAWSKVVKRLTKCLNE